MSWATLGAAGISGLLGLKSSRDARRANSASRRYYNQLADIERRRWGAFERHGLPLFVDIAEDAAEGPGSERYADWVGQASADASQSYDFAQDSLERLFQRYGAQPGQGLHAGAARDLALARAGGTAAAMTSARRAVDRDAYMRRMDAAKLMASLGGSGAGLASAGAGLAQQGLGHGLAAAGHWGNFGSALGDWLARRGEDGGT